MRLMKRLVCAGLAPLFLSAAAAPPANVPAPADDEIVVTAVPDNPAERRTQVARFVGKVAQAATQGQLSRRNGPFCPKVLGLEDKYTPMVLRKVRDAAAAAHARELPEGCKTNLLIIFTRDGDALMRALRSKRPGFFLPLDLEKKRELFGTGRAVRWWYENAGRDANGALAGDDPSRMTAGASAAEMAITPVYSSSLITTNITINLSGNVVVIDVNKADGYPLDAIAAYAAMVSFAQVSARDAMLGNTPSVLGMFARPGPRLTALRDLTAWDRAYLDGLYRIPMNRRFQTQRRALTTAMNKAIVAE